MLDLLRKHIGCPSARYGAILFDEVLTIGDDDYLSILFGIKDRDRGEIMLRVHVYEAELKRSRLNNAKDFIKADWANWISSKVWLVDPKREQIGKLIRDRKGLGTTDERIYIRAFDRAIGAKQFMGQYIARDSQLLSLSNNKMSQLLNC